VKQVLWIAVGIIIGLLAAGLILLVVSQPRGQPVTLVPPPTDSPLTVHVSGAVKTPGVYQVSSGARVQDAITAAGGFSANADPQSVNLAARLIDGTKIIVLEKPVPGQPSSPATPTSPAPSIYNPIDLNTATAEMLDALPGIGPSKAQDIVSYRETNGAFTTLDDLLNVPGIGEGILEQIKPYIIVKAEE
jgi:competence protein ComEA